MAEEHSSRRCYKGKPVIIKACVDCGAEIQTKQDRRVRCDTCRNARNAGLVPLASQTRECVECGSVYRPTNPNDVLCQDCRFVKGELLQCHECGTEFKAKSKYRPMRDGVKVSYGLKPRFCSRSCVGKASKRKHPYSGTPRRWRTRLVWFKHCPCCGDLYSTRSADRPANCGKHDCRREWGAARSWCVAHGVPISVRVYRKAKAERDCTSCGVRYTPTQASTANTCPECLRSKHSRTHKAKRRAVTRGAGAESIDPIAIFNRDGWRCYICGVDTPSRLRGSLDGDAPELDHIIPIAKGGTHTEDNVACCCRDCNQLKGDQLLEDFRAWAGTDSRLR